MAKLPNAPSSSSLAALDPKIKVMPAGSPLARIFFRGGAHPVDWDEFRHWGPAGSRFDHHTRDAAGLPCVGPRGILYAAGNTGPGALAVCIAEVFQNTRIIDDRNREPWFVIFDTARELTLLDLRGIWTTKAGASAAINSGPKRRAQDWSRTFYEAYPKIGGIIYPSCMGGNADAVALYERAKSALPVRPRFHRALSGRELRPALARAAEAIGYARI